MSKQIKIKITSAVVLAEGIVGAGSTRTVDESLAKDLLRRGKAELAAGKAKGSAKSDDPDSDKPLDEMKVAELKSVAEGHAIEGAASMNKADLITAIKEAEDAADDE